MINFIVFCIRLINYNISTVLNKQSILNTNIIFINIISTILEQRDRLQLQVALAKAN